MVLLLRYQYYCLSGVTKKICQIAPCAKAKAQKIIKSKKLQIRNGLLPSYNPICSKNGNIYMKKPQFISKTVAGAIVELSVTYEFIGAVHKTII